MNVLINQKTIKRSRLFSRICFYGFLGFLTLGLVFTFYPITPIRTLNLIITAFFLLVCYCLLRINMSMANRWETKPRIDERITSALKGLTSDFYLCHYVTYNAHILIGPTCIWLIDTSDFSGEILFDEKSDKWLSRVNGGFFERLIKPSRSPNVKKLEAQALKDWKKTLAVFKEKDPSIELQTPDFVLAFLDEHANPRSSSSRVSLIRLDKLKDFVRKQVNPSQKQKESLKKLLAVLLGS